MKDHQFLIAMWEARAEELERAAQQQRSTFMGLVAQTLEKARAFRKCIEDLKRYGEETQE